LEIRRLRQLIMLRLSHLHVSCSNAGVDHSTPIAPSLVQLESNRSSITHALESHVISISHNDEILVSNLLRPIKHVLYYQPLQEKLKRDNNWTESQFSTIDWPSYKCALRKLPRSQRISISKLSHQLWNTNRQNKQYYNYSNLCPYCQQEEESILHVFTCKHPVANQNREEALQTTFHSLQSSGSPPMLLACIQSGLQQWISNPSLSAFVPPHDVLLKPKSTSALAAFSAQSTIGWGALLRGHMASQWNIAFQCLYQPKKNKKASPSVVARLAKQWSSKTIQLFWT
jgi:hypothetical protein